MPLAYRGRLSATRRGGWCLEVGELLEPATIVGGIREADGAEVVLAARTGRRSYVNGRVVNGRVSGDLGIVSLGKHATAATG